MATAYWGTILEEILADQAGMPSTSAHNSTRDNSDSCTAIELDAAVHCLYVMYTGRKTVLATMDDNSRVLLL